MFKLSVKKANKSRENWINQISYLHPIRPLSGVCIVRSLILAYIDQEQLSDARTIDRLTVDQVKLKIFS